jgi:[ribosomal protein S18]-alanine N-acetyltransferase
MTLETATKAHADAMAAIHAAAFVPEERWNANVMGLQLGILGAFGFIDPDGGMVLARVAADEAEILTIAVLPALRGQGMGRRLLDAAMDEARRRGAREMFLEVATGNTPAKALYVRAGFTRVGQRKRYYPGGGDALVLRAELGDDPLLEPSP